MRRFEQLALAFVFFVMSPWPTLGAVKGKEKLPPPFIFSLGRLPPSALNKLKKVSGVEKAELQKNERIRVVWQGFAEGSEKWHPAKGIYEFLAIKEKIGKTKWTHGGLTLVRAGTIIKRSGQDALGFFMAFTDWTTGRNNTLNLQCFNQVKSGQVKHEMLRFFVGKDVSIEKCGNGYVLVKQTGFGPYVVWQVNDQMFAGINQSYDKEMVAAYIDRLGCITKKDVNLDVDKWIEDEIRWRVEQMDYLFEKKIKLHRTRSVVSKRWPYINSNRSQRSGQAESKRSEGAGCPVKWA